MPREWIAPPDYDTADGELLDEDFDERTSMLQHGEHQGRYRSASEEEEARQDARGAASGSRSEQGGSRGNHWHASTDDAPRVVNLKETDSSGHKIPAAERAPLSKNLI